MSTERRIKRKGNRLQMGGEGTASKTKVSFDRSKAPGEHLRISFSRHDPDDSARWSCHFKLDQAVFIVVSILSHMPAHAVLAVFATVAEWPEVKALLEREPPEAP